MARSADVLPGEVECIVYIPGVPRNACAMTVGLNGRSAPLSESVLNLGFHLTSSTSKARSKRPSTLGTLFNWFWIVCDAFGSTVGTGVALPAVASAVAPAVPVCVGAVVCVGAEVAVGDGNVEGDCVPVIVGVIDAGGPTASCTPSSALAI